MDGIEQWGISVCCAAIAGGVMHMISPGAAMERIFRIVVGVFFVCTVLSPLTELNDFELHQGWLINEHQKEEMMQDYENAADSIFETTAMQTLGDLAAKKLAELGINDALVSVYMTEKTNGELKSEDIAIEIELAEEYKDRHTEICKYLEYELGTTIRIGYRK